MKKVTVNTLIIGAGQTGLLCAYYLHKKGIDVLLIDKNNSVGDSWRDRYDCLSLLTPWEDNYLTGYHKQKKKSYPDKDEYAVYLKEYAQKFSFRIDLRTEVISVKKKDNVFIVYTKNKKYIVKRIIVATGPFQSPFVPSTLGNIPKSIFQIHSSEYKNPRSVPKKNVLIVGGGYSGMQIANDLAKSKNVTLSLSQKPFYGNRFDVLYKIAHAMLPENMIRDLVKKLGIRKLHTPELETLFQSDAIIVKPKLSSINNETFIFTDKTQATYDSIIWATGYTFDFSWILIPELFDTMGKIRHQDGVTQIDGLYIVYPDRDYGFIKDLEKKTSPILRHIIQNV